MGRGEQAWTQEGGAARAARPSPLSSDALRVVLTAAMTLGIAACGGGDGAGAGGADPIEDTTSGDATGDAGDGDDRPDAATGDADGTATDASQADSPEVGADDASDGSGASDAGRDAGDADASADAPVSDADTDGGDGPDDAGDTDASNDADDAGDTDASNDAEDAVPRCVGHDACEVGARCEATGACRWVGWDLCSADDDCGRGWTCGDSGRCVACAETPDCADGMECRHGVCRLPPLGAVAFESEFPEGLRDHAFHWLPCDVVGYGGGGGVFDVDGDGRMDVVAGTHAYPGAAVPVWCQNGLEVPEDATDAPPCVYRNVSEPGALRFEREATLCDGALPRFTSAAGVDVEGDGRDELLLLGEGTIRLLRLWPERRIDLLVDHTGPDHVGLPCYAGAALSIDLDMDGEVEVLVGCQAGGIRNAQTDEDLASNIVLRRDGDTYVVDTRPEWETLRDPGVSLALGLVDLNEDGLFDVAVANDSFSVVGRRNTHLWRGFLAERCGPGEGCVFGYMPFVQDNSAWGSFMGVGHVRVAGHNALYVTDWGANRLVRWSDGVLVDEAIARGAANRDGEGRLLFAWSALSDDLNFDGLDDVFVTNGRIPDADMASQLAHVDALLVQQPDGTFLQYNEDIGLRGSALADSTHAEIPSSSRSAVRLDLDGDGALDLLVKNYPGRFRVYRETSAERGARRRCTIFPRTRWVGAFGAGFAVRDDGRDTFTRREIQGSMRLGAPRTILASEPEGTLRFPSGAEVRFRCAEGETSTEVEEPEWIGWRVEGTTLRVEVDPRVFPRIREATVVFVRGADGAVREVEVTRDGDSTLVVPIAAGDAAFLIRAGGVHVPRWFPLSP